MRNNIRLNLTSDEQEITAFIITPKFGCCTKKISIDDIPKMVGSEIATFPADKYIAFYANDSTCIPYQKRKDPPTQIINIGGKAIFFYGTIVICGCKKYNENSEFPQCELQSLNQAQLSTLSKKFDYRTYIINPDGEYKTLMEQDNAFTLICIFENKCYFFVFGNSYTKDDEDNVIYTIYAEWDEERK